MMLALPLSKVSAFTYYVFRFSKNITRFILVKAVDGVFAIRLVSAAGQEM